MKKFVANILLAGVGAAMLLAIVLAIRIYRWQGNVRDTFTLPEGTEVVYIGNSHSGCTWTEAPEFKNKVLWNASRSFLYHLLRLRELDRLNDLQNVKVCVMDMGRPAIRGFYPDDTRGHYFLRHFREELPAVWRYALDIPVFTPRVLAEAFLSGGAECNLQAKRTDAPKPWYEWGEEKQARYIEDNYSDHPIWGKFLDTFPSSATEDTLVQLVAEAQAICDRNGIRFILVSTPLASQNPQRIHPDEWSLETTDIQNKLKDMGVQYLDLRASCPDTMFRDADHLHRAASYSFTKSFHEGVLTQYLEPQCWSNAEGDREK